MAHISKNVGRRTMRLLLGVLTGSPTMTLPNSQYVSDLGKTIYLI